MKSGEVGCFTIAQRAPSICGHRLLPGHPCGHVAIWLVVLTILKKHEFVNGKDDNPYMKWKIKDVPNHQPAMEMDNDYFNYFYIIQVNQCQSSLNEGAAAEASVPACCITTFTVFCIKSISTSLRCKSKLDRSSVAMKMTSAAGPVRGKQSSAARQATPRQR